MADSYVQSRKLDLGSRPERINVIQIVGHARQAQAEL